MTDLKQMDNEVYVLGRLKTLNLREQEGRKPGTTNILGNVVVDYVDDDKNIHNVRASVFVTSHKRNGEPNSVYDGYVKIMNEFKDADHNDDPDTVVIRGSLESNDYVSTKTQSLVSDNQVRASFINRFVERENTKEEDKKPRAEASIEVYVDSILDELDFNGEPTGRKKVELYSVGYGNRVTELQNVFVDKSISEEFENTYYPGVTGTLTFDINNYVSTEDVTDETVEDNHAFGQRKPKVMETRAVNHYVNELVVVGGEQPLENGLTEDEVKEIKSLRADALIAASARTNVQTVTDKKEPTPEKKPGFGRNSGTASNPFKGADVTDGEDLPVF